MEKSGMDSDLRRKCSPGRKPEAETAPDVSEPLFVYEVLNQHLGSTSRSLSFLAYAVLYR